MAVIDSNGVSIFYEDIGSGVPIVLVHGFASNIHGNWRRSGWIDFLHGLGRRVVALDVRGHGQSGKPHGIAAYEGNALPDDVLAVMDAVGLEETEIMGYSMGGWITLNLLARMPERFSSAIVGGSGLHTGAPSREHREVLATGLEAADDRLVTDPVAQRFRRLAMASGDNDLQALAAVQRSERTRADEASLRRVRVPVQVVVGERDGALSSAQRLVEVMPNAALTVLPGEDHISAVRSSGYRGAVAEFLAVRLAKA
jgi:pimeloyl-ACP methyl ester carboxylesterase